MKCRGILGATTVDENTKKEIFAATKELLREMLMSNEVTADDIACILFTTTADLNAAFPAEAARELGLEQVPLLCGHEIDVPSSLPMCLRVMLLFNTEKAAEDIDHIYIRGATELRPESGNKEAGVEG